MLRQSSNIENKLISKKFLKINHKNYITLLEEDSLINLKISLYKTLAPIQEEIIGREIDKIFQDFIPDSNADILKTMITQCQNMFNTKYKGDITKFFEDLKTSLDNIIQKNYNMEFYFFNNNIEELALVLVYSYLELSDFIFDRNITKTKYKINTYKDFIKAIDNLLDKNVDVIKRYRDNLNGKNSFSSDLTRSSFSSVNNNNNNSNNNNNNSHHPNHISSLNNSSRLMNSSAVYEREFLFTKRPKQNLTNSALFNYTQSHINQIKQDFELPIEFVILLNKFQTVKRLKIFVPNKINDLSAFLLVLSNIEWLFPNLFEIELDLSMGNLHGEFYDSYYNTYRKEKLYGFRKYSRDLNRGNSTNMTYTELIKQNRHHLDLLIIYSYYISKLDKIKILILNFPESLQLEISEALKLSHLNLTNLHLLSLFTNIQNLYQLSLDFNSLDYVSFQKMISIIFKNNQMKCLKLNLFGGEEYGNYSSNGLFKLSSIFNLNLKTGINGFNKVESEYLYFDSFAAESDILNKLLKNFEENLENLFYVLQLKMALSDLQIKADLPRIISNSDKYVLVFHKFLFDIFRMLNNTEDNSSIHTLKVIIPYLPFDNRKYPTISKFFKTVNFNENPKLEKFTNLSIHLRFNKVFHLENIIHHRLKFLQIGDLDSDTFADLTKYFTSYEFRKNSQLNTLNLSLSNIINDYQSVKYELDSFLSSEKPQNLKEIFFNSSLILNEDEIKRIYKFINYDTVEKYSFTFSKKCNEIFLNVARMNGNSSENESVKSSRNLSTTGKNTSDKSFSSDSENPQLFYKIENKKINSKIINLIQMILIYKMKNSNNSNRSILNYFNKFLFSEKIYKGVRDYLLNYEKKEIQIVFK